MSSSRGKLVFYMSIFGELSVLVINIRRTSFSMSRFGWLMFSVGVENIKFSSISVRNVMYITHVRDIRTSN